MHILQFTTEGESIYKDTQNARNTQITLCRWKESGTCPSGTDEPPGKATFNATLRCKIVAGQAAHKLADALPADIRGSGHGQQSVAPLAALAPQPPAHRAGLSPWPPGAIIAREPQCQCDRKRPESAYINIIPSGLCNKSLGPLPHRLFSLRTQSRLC